MESRIDARGKDFKKPTDDPLRRRENEQLQIRKAVREAHLAKKRGQNNTNPAKPEPEAKLTFANKSLESTLTPDILPAVLSTNDSIALSAVQAVRRTLSSDRNPPIQDVINLGLVKPFIDILVTRKDFDKIRLEAAWALTNIASGDTAQTNEVVKAGGITALGDLLTHENSALVEQALWGLGNIAGDGPVNRSLIIQSGVLNTIMQQLNRCHEPNLPLTIIKYGIWCLSNMSRGCPGLTRLHASQIIDIIRQVLIFDDPDILSDGSWCCFYLIETFVQENDRSVVSELIKVGIPIRLIELLADPHGTVQGPALRCIGTILTGDDDQTQTMIHFGCIPKLHNLLHCPRKHIRKEACWAISNITAGTVAQIEEVIAAGIIPTICDLTVNAEYDIRREAAWVLCNACNGCGRAQMETLVELGIIPALCSLLALADIRILQICLEAIIKILAVGKEICEAEALTDNPYSIKLEENHAFEHLEMMQHWDDKPRIQQLAIKIIRDYLDVVNEDENMDMDANSANIFSSMN